MGSRSEPGHGVIVYDFLFCRGGAEQVTLTLARNLPGTDVCVAFRDRDAFPPRSVEALRCLELSAPPRLRLPVWRTLSGLHHFRRRAPFLADYDWAIFSGSNAPVAVHHRKGLRNLYYCHTIPRFAYDLYNWYLESLPPWQRPAFRALASHVRGRYENALSAMDVIIVNSENVRARLQRHIGHDALVINPPCETEAFQWIEDGDYYLSTARLERYKRIDVIISAFRRMPHCKLVIASGGSDEPRLRALADGADNISFVGWQSAGALRRLVGSCLATVYVAKDEDFGISPVESMAAGKPVIGVAEGGMLETVKDGETGILVPAPPTAESIGQAVRALSANRAREMRHACEQRAQQYSVNRFTSRIRALVQGGSKRT